MGSADETFLSVRDEHCNVCTLTRTMKNLEVHTMPFRIAHSKNIYLRLFTSSCNHVVRHNQILAVPIIDDEGRGCGPVEADLKDVGQHISGHLGVLSFSDIRWSPSSVLRPSEFRSRSAAGHWSASWFWPGWRMDGHTGSPPAKR